MILIVGLGNPGRKFKNTRHNLGFKMIDLIKKQGSFSLWQNKKKLRAKIAKGKIGRQKIILAKPQTFMNQTGVAVKALKNLYKIPLKNIWLIHDDLDLALGKIRIKKNSTASGHKGVQSVIDELGSKNFHRLKIGIGPRPKKDVKKFVLEKFLKKELKDLEPVKKQANNILLEAIKV